MTLGEFIDEMNGAPIELHELADSAVAKIDSNDITAHDLLSSAQVFIDAKAAFEAALHEVGIEEG